MKYYNIVGILLFISHFSPPIVARQPLELDRPVESEFIHGLSEPNCNTKPREGTRWAVLIAGSTDYENYRHQADVCHAYQVLKKGGLKDENIIVFMYDDIAFNVENPRPGVIINKPGGDDVYQGVPKDYTQSAATVSNLFAVILGHKTAVQGGSGKVLDSGPDDHVFIYYIDHGAAGIIGMPNNQLLYAKDLIHVLKKKHEAKAYKTMVIYLEACQAGSMFQGLLPNDWNIYATTSSNSHENSYGTYCPDDYPSSPPDFDTCLGDTFSVAWLEDSEKQNLCAETLEKQYKTIRRRVITQSLDYRSHVTQYGDKKLSKEVLFTYIGTNPNNNNYTFMADFKLSGFSSVNQYDAELLHFWYKFHRAPKGSVEKLEAQKELHGKISHRMHVDYNMKEIGRLVMGSENATMLLLETVRPSDQPVVEDWDCYKMLVKTYEECCGSLSRYALKYTRVLANMCNLGIKREQVAEASAQACAKHKP